MPEAPKSQPWKAAWPAKDTNGEKKDNAGRIQHFKLSGNRAAEYGYNDEDVAEEATVEQK